MGTTACFFVCLSVSSNRRQKGAFMEKKGRILTGHRATGPRHIGHLVGTLNTWVSLQDSFDCYFLVADLHALTTDFAQADRIRQNTLEILTDWLAAGIDPNRSTLVLQSAIPEHALLSLLLSMLAPVSRLERVPSYKDQIKQLNLNPSLGLLTYPVLQAADILLYKADTVPVGEDQLPHLELGRELARRFNQLYTPLFPEPQALLSATPRLPGTDNRTMHTSYGNAIYLKDTPEETTRKVMSMFTDPTRIHPNDPGHVEGNPVFAYLDSFDPDAAQVTQMKALYRVGKIGDVEVKEHLAEVLNAALAPIRERRAELAGRPQELLEMLRFGTGRARLIAQATIEEVMQAMGLTAGLDLSASAQLDAAQSAKGIFC
jgi:tryptophanyl-tRNA synthetase